MGPAPVNPPTLVSTGRETALTTTVQSRVVSAHTYNILAIKLFEQGAPSAIQS